MAENTSNALGLDFSQLTVEEKPESQEPVTAEQSSQTVVPDPSSRKEHKEKPYVNPERVKTGGSQRDKLSDEALEERMARIRQQNEKIKQRRIDVQADEAAFRQTQEQEREKQIQNRKIQSEIDRARDQNAQRKMAKVQSREWDSGKPSNNAPRNIRPPAYSQTDAAPQQGPVEDDTAPSPTIAQEANADSGNWIRGGPHQRGRGRGRGRGSGRGGNFNNRRDTPQSATSAPEGPKQEDSDEVAPST